LGDCSSEEALGVGAGSKAQGAARAGEDTGGHCDCGVEAEVCERQLMDLIEKGLTDEVIGRSGWISFLVQTAFEQMVTVEGRCFV
jgi:hypothetical protein